MNYEAYQLTNLKMIHDLTLYIICRNLRKMSMNAFSIELFGYLLSIDLLLILQYTSK